MFQKFNPCHNTLHIPVPVCPWQRLLAGPAGHVRYDTQRTLLLGSVVVASTELLFPRDTMHATSISMMEQPPRPGWNDDRAPLLIGVTAGCLTLTLVFVVLRFYVRATVIRKWGPDDSLVVISYILTLITGVVFCVSGWLADPGKTKGTTVGLGKHIWTIPTEVQQAGRRLIISATLSYQVTFIVIKMAFLLQYRRVFALPKFVLCCDIMLGFISMFGIAVVVSSIIISAPSWRGDTFARERKLRLKPMQKVALIVSFGLGFVTTCISVVRMSTLPHVFTRDVTWDVIPALVWSEIELCCAVICACIPTLRPLMRVAKSTRTQREYDRQTSGASGEARLARKPVDGGTFGSQSQQSLPSPMFVDIEPCMDPRAEPKTPSIVSYSDNIVTTTLDISPALTAGGSDDGSEEFGPADVEISTPLSPPPQCYASPARLLPRSRAASESTVEE
ncbi:Integral membrane protein [Colletotrichum higginsianum IMI 349063]|uniref:Integral membrane protein n=1 Tax=Colletotrichum higginsianum (strain IMI 349063) TaxID=759273 RepID=A0A1B7Y451_COLHI|nr:Integral membrane protein [Colletotrichum higginsianum IMI 349063]OBR06827.1 Integral membrane protein [Colletotrichum higginsianum IMI 349063]